VVLSRFLFFFPDSLAFKLFASSIPGVSTMKILFASLVWAEGCFLMGTSGYIPLLRSKEVRWGTTVNQHPPAHHPLDAR
jgi:hypothetical protein